MELETEVLESVSLINTPAMSTDIRLGVTSLLRDQGLETNCLSVGTLDPGSVPTDKHVLTLRHFFQAIINLYLGDNARTDAISNRLREVCPTLYNNDDAIDSKAQEILVSMILFFFPLSLTMRPNKLELLSLETLSSQVLEFECKARSNPIGVPFRCFLLGQVPSVSSKC